MRDLKKTFEEAYRRYNRPEYIHPDPLEFALRYRDPLDSEVAGLAASSLAYGNVKQIFRSVEKVLTPMGKSPRRFLLGASDAEIRKTYSAFKHRFTTGAELALFLINLRDALKKYGTLEKCFLAGYDPAAPTVEEAVYRFVLAMNPKLCTPTMIPCPGKKSSFKRLNLFLRWMVRRDAIDPGHWKKVSPAKLIVPLDTHMRQVAMKLGLTRRKDTGMKTALEITAAFRKTSPADPVKYDFALTRAGILKLKA